MVSLQLGLALLPTSLLSPRPLGFVAGLLPIIYIPYIGLRRAKIYKFGCVFGQ